MLQGAVLFGVLLGVAACFDPALPAVACGPDGQCPDGLRCDPVDSMCRGALLDPADAAMLVDAASDASAVFGAPEPLAGISAGGIDGDPSLTGDMLEIYFTSNRDGGVGGRDIWRARRSSVADEFDSPEPVIELCSNGADSDANVSRDGLTIFFLTSGGSVHVATRASRDQPFSVPVEVPELNAVFGGGASSPDESLLSIAMCAHNGSDFDLFLATRPDTTSPFDTPAAIEELNTTDADCSPVFGSGTDVIVWSTSRPGGLGGRDLWRATRAGPSDPYTDLEPIVELNSPTLESDPWLSPDGRTIVFSSSRAGREAIYVATR